MSDRVKRILKREEVLLRRRPFPNAEGEEDLYVADRPDGAGKANVLATATILPPATEEELKSAWQDGFQEGYRQAQEDLRPLIASLREATRTVQEERDRLIRDAELVVVRLAYEVAKKIVGHEVQMRSDAIVYIVREALRRIADRDRIVIRLNPQDARAVRNHPALRPELFDSFEAVEIREDEEVGRGSCLVETSSGLIDASLDTQLAEIEAALFGED
ncbi:MAG: FliH/SctL family protein [candidate division KSB1 bacterium]|nr:FliH/SctL family protein [candidate division KSB1 bacterium]